MAGGCAAQVGEEVLGTAAKVSVSKESTTIVGDGTTEDAVRARVSQIKHLVSIAEQDYEREKLNERIARLAGGVAIIQVPPLPLLTFRRSNPIADGLSHLHLLHEGLLAGSA